MRDCGNKPHKMRSFPHDCGIVTISQRIPLDLHNARNDGARCGHTYSNIHKLETVQRRSARRIMHSYTIHASVTTMLQHLDLPTLQQRRQHSKIIMLYRIIHQQANILTTTYITPATRNTQHYILPYARTYVYKSSFFPSTVKLWNNLQPAIINRTTIPQLRLALQSTPTSGGRGATLSA